MQPKIYLAATQGATGSTVAVLQIESHADVYGWFLESCEWQFTAAFFMLESFYAKRTTVLYRSARDDAYGHWLQDHPPTTHPIRCPLPEGVIHELERSRAKLIHEWLSFDDPDAPAAGPLSIGSPGVPIGLRAVNIKPHKWRRMLPGRQGWQHQTAGFDQNVVDYLQKHGRFTPVSMTRQ